MALVGVRADGAAGGRVRGGSARLADAAPAGLPGAAAAAAWRAPAIPYLTEPWYC